MYFIILSTLSTALHSFGKLIYRLKDKVDDAIDEYLEKMEK